MARIQIIDSTLHGATDYTAATTLLSAFPRLVGLSGTRSGRQLRIAGAVHGSYSIVTDYPLGVLKLVPYRAHLAIDALGAVALGAAPFLSGQFRRGRRHWVPHVALAGFELVAVALSDPTAEGAFHGDVEAVRAANELDPHERIYDGPPAVTIPAGAG